MLKSFNYIAYIEGILKGLSYPELCYFKRYRAGNVPCEIYEERMCRNLFGKRLQKLAPCGSSVTRTIETIGELIKELRL